MTSQTVDRAPSVWRQAAIWAARVGLANKLAVVLTVAAVLAGFATYAVLTESPPFGHDPNTAYLLLNLDLIILLLLSAVIARRLVGIWVQRRRGRAGSRLHIRKIGRGSGRARGGKDV